MKSLKEMNEEENLELLAKLHEVVASVLPLDSGFVLVLYRSEEGQAMNFRGVATNFDEDSISKCLDDSANILRSRKKSEVEIH